MLDRQKDIPYCGVRKDVIDQAVIQLDADILSYLYEFVKDRYTVHYNKDVLKIAAPWTDNTILQQVKFTNVRREHDRESKLLIEHIASKTDMSIKDRCFNIMLMRFWNKYESFRVATGGKLLKFPLSDADFDACVDRINKETEHKFWSGAYYTAPVRNYKTKKYGRESAELESGYADSPLYFARSLFTDDLWDRMESADSPKELFDILKKLPNMGNFICFQWFVDFTYMPDFWFSENHFTVSGPGCSKGIDLLFKDRDGMTHDEAIFWMRDNQHFMFKEFGYDPKDLFKDLPVHDRFINLMSFENLMCELQKYVKCKASVAIGKKPRGKMNYDGVGKVVSPQIDLFDI